MKSFKHKLNKKVLLSSIIAVIFILSLSVYFFMNNNENFYDKTIAKITNISETTSKIQDTNGREESVTQQNIKALIMNGKYKGRQIALLNKTTFSKINDLDLKINDEVFIQINKNSSDNKLSASITDFKRDKYAAYITILFIFLILLIGGYKGFKSLSSVIINILIFLLLIELYSHNFNFTAASIAASILFIVLSISIVSGFNKKTLSAISSTIISTVISMVIALLVIKLNNWNGVHFEEMELLTHPPEDIFLSEILIGTLGSIMDISISISSSIKEIYESNPSIGIQDIIKSGIEIGKDIMGTMANTLMFAYAAGSIPIMLLLLKNGYSISYIVNINLSLEFIRALTGSIGIVLSIPISIYTSVFFIKKYSIGEI